MLFFISFEASVSEASVNPGFEVLMSSSEENMLASEVFVQQPSFLDE